MAATSWTAQSNLKPGRGDPASAGAKQRIVEDLDDTDHNLYFAQAAGAVFVRQALLTAVLRSTRSASPNVLKLTIDSRADFCKAY